MQLKKTPSLSLQGDAWAETQYMGYKWFFFTCDNQRIYDITDWADCNVSIFFFFARVVVVLFVFVCLFCLLVVGCLFVYFFFRVIFVLFCFYFIFILFLFYFPLMRSTHKNCFVNNNNNNNRNCPRKFHQINTMCLSGLWHKALRDQLKSRLWRTCCVA